MNKNGGDGMRNEYIEKLASIKQVETNRLYLRRFSLVDYLAVYAYGSDQECLKYMTWEGVYSHQQAKEVIKHSYLVNPGTFAMEEKESGVCIGCMDIQLIPQHEKANVGYIMRREYWNFGYMTEALKATLRICFDVLQLNRVEANHFGGNEASGKVMQHAFMQLEGVSKQEVICKGEYVDLHHYAILKEDWEEIHSNENERLE